MKGHVKDAPRMIDRPPLGSSCLYSVERDQQASLDGMSSWVCVVDTLLSSWPGTFPLQCRVVREKGND